MRVLLLFLLASPPVLAFDLYGRADVPTAGVFAYAMPSWPPAAPHRWSGVGLPGRVLVRLQRAVPFALHQRCRTLDRSGDVDCGRRAAGWMLPVAGDPSLLCRVGPRAHPVAVWLPGPDDAHPGSSALALPARCSTGRLADVGQAAVSDGVALPALHLSHASSPYRAFLAARARLSGLWALIDPDGFVHPERWVGERLRTLPSAPGGDPSAS